MIDFRYHLVSLVSVFLALAVGIVLGAGPLKDPISEGLSARVDALRQDRDALGAQLKTAQAATSNRDTFITDVQDHLVAGQLEGRSVVLLTLPGAEADAVGPLTQAVAAAGGRLTGRVDLQDAWADPASRSARDAAIADLRRSAGGTSGTSATASRTPSPSPTASGTAGSASDTAAAEVLAHALVTTDTSPAERPDETSRTLLDGLAHAGLVNVNGDIPGRANAVVILAPGVATAVQGSAVPTPTPSPTPDGTPAWMALASVLDADSSGAVVVGPASSATTGGILAAVRAQQPLATAVSTVDTGGTPMGDVTTVLALHEQQQGSAAATASVRGRRPSCRRGAATADALPAGRGRRLVPLWQSAAVAHLRTLLAGTAAARLAWAALTRRPPAGEARWQRTNHRGEPLTLLEGPALAAGACAALVAAPGLDGRTRAAGVVAVAGSAAFGVLDDLAERGSRKGLRGHLGALARGEVTTGGVKVAGLAVTGAVAAGLVLGPKARPRDLLPAAALVAGCANLANLLDLRPGRALKVALLPAPAVLSGAPAGAFVAAVAGPAAALLPEDLASAPCSATGARTPPGRCSGSRSSQARDRGCVSPRSPASSGSPSPARR